MQIRKLFSFVACACLLASLTSAFSNSGDEKLKSADHKSLAKTVSAYWQAKIEKNKINENFVKFSNGVDKATKRLKGKHEILACMDDWSQVFWIATRSGLENVSKAKKKVSSWPQYGSRFPTFTYVVPKKHSAKKDPYPVLLIIADEGEDPEEHLAAKWSDEALRAGYILVVVEMRNAVALSGGKVKRGAVGEPIPVDKWGQKEGVYSVLFTFGNLTRSEAFAIDYNRVFIAGSGKGFEVAATAAQWFPHQFAGLIGRGELPKDLFSPNLGNMGAMIAGESEGGTEFLETMGKLGHEGIATGADADADIVVWMKEQVRNPYPTKLSFQYPSNSTLASYWLNAKGIDVDAEGGSRIDAEVDRESNTITITAKQVGSLSISYNDVLVDLDKPVKVIINGKTFEETLVRNKRTLIEGVFRFRDWGNLKTAESTYAVPKLEEEE